MASSEAKASATADTVTVGQNAEQLGGRLGISATTTSPEDQSGQRPVMRVYTADGNAIGTVVDLGPNRVIASSITPAGLVRLGAFADRTAARRAVEAHHGLAGGAR
jgi:hypothetical protein